MSKREIQAKNEPCVVSEAKPNSPCQAGVVAVDDQRWVRCVQTGTAGAEVCDGVDNNCNGATDEGYARPPGCDNGTGACKTQGTWSCVDGKEVCTPRAPQPEVCDGQDNDCNGKVDDVPPQGKCHAAAQGVCSEGTLYCNGQCVAGQPGRETCDCADNDCNGIVDDLGACPVAVLWEQGPDANGKELTRNPKLPTDLIDTTGAAGPSSCGEDEHGRRYTRREVEVWAESANGATCEFVGWVDPSPYDCRINVHFKTKRLGSNVWCNGRWKGVASGVCKR